LLLWIVTERVTGWVMYLRKHVEHDGLWVPGAHFFETQCFSTRNVRTNRAMEVYFSGLSYHSVHHAFPRIPFYAMAEAHRRIDALYAGVGRPLPMDEGYARTFRDLWRASRERGAPRAPRPG
jgi:fatty acid desaturase